MPMAFFMVERVSSEGIIVRDKASRSRLLPDYGKTSKYADDL
jgi:hypothetical protein